jgi:hypothetical protein
MQNGKVQNGKNFYNFTILDLTCFAILPFYHFTFD